MPEHKLARLFVAVAVAFGLLAGSVRAQDTQSTRHEVSGMVIEVHPSRERFVVSHEAIPGVMSAMTMPFDVRSAKELDEVRPGARVTFTLVVGSESTYAERVRVIRRTRARSRIRFTARRLQRVDRDCRGRAKTAASPLARPFPTSR